jgi:UDP-N-acetylmuramate--alanine ligase
LPIDAGKVLLVDDYGHHPRELDETLPALLRDGDLVLLLGAGDIGAVAADLAKRGHLKTEDAA